MLKWVWWLVGVFVLLGCNAPVVDIPITASPSTIPTLPPTVTPTSEPTNTPVIPMVFADDIPTPNIATPTPTTPFNKNGTPLPSTPTRPPCADGGATSEDSYPSRVEGPTRTFLIYLPPCYETQTEQYPVLFLLHGNALGQEEWDLIDIDAEAETLIKAGEISPLIIVMPEGRTVSDVTSGGDFSYEAVLVDELIPYLDATYRTNSERAIGGLSRGGYWAAEIAFRNPDLFRAVGLHAPVFLDNGTDRDINPIWTVNTAPIESLCIAFDFGSEDIYIGTAQSIRSGLIARDIPFKWTLYPNEEHRNPYWANHRGEYLRWYDRQWGGCDLR